MAWLALGKSGPGLCARGQTVRIGAVEVPADCPLARREHPRLLFTKADIPKLRERISTPGPIRDYYLFAKQMIDDGLRRGSQRAKDACVMLGLLYHLTGDERYGQACRDFVVHRGTFGVYAALGLYGYDMVYDLLTPEERRACEDKSVEFLRREKWRPRARALHALAIYGCGHDEELIAEQVSLAYRYLVEHKKKLNAWAANRGGAGNSHGYIGQHEYVGTMGAMQAWKCCTGEDLFEGFNWAKYMASYYVYHYLPGRTDTCHIGINCWGNNSFPAETGACNFTAIAAAKWQDGLAQWWVRNVIMAGRRDYQVFNRWWGALLWLDPSIPELSPDNFPETRLFPVRGYLCMRSDWSPQATFAHFHCGRFESDWRNNADNNSFIIYKHDYLACDSGTRGLNNPELKDMSDGRHHNRYFVQTIAHNSITVGTEDIAGNGWTAVCGGQVSRPKKEWLVRWGIPITGENLYTPQAGKIVAYETSPLFDYCAGDATRSYSPDKVALFVRQFVYVKPDYFVIFDRVRSVRAEDPKRWYCHTMGEPRSLDGAEVRDTSVHPEGHFLFRGRTWTAEHHGGRLFCTTLLPERATIRKIGGKGHQFEVNGENYDMYDVWYERVGQDFLNRIGIGWWRVEVEPQTRENDDLFLHVLQAADANVAQMVPVERVEEGGRVGARVLAGRRTFVVLFNKSGPVGGRIAIVEGGRTLLDRPLAQNVQDNYRQWKTDPRYKQWTTNKYFRCVIGEE